MKQTKILFLAFSLAAIFVACEKEAETVLTHSHYTVEEYNQLSKNLDLPEQIFPYSFRHDESDPATDHIGTLGRVLFYDNKLSSDLSVSCASCHEQSLAFSDNKAVSEGPHGNFTKRNSIALGAVRSFGAHYDDTVDDKTIPGLFWDERAVDIKQQLRETINNPNEMGMELSEIVEIVNTTDYYQILHSKAFGQEDVTEDHILEALETFINSISAKDTKFESELIGQLNFITGDSVSGVTEFDLGFRLFQDNCNSCHGQSLQIPINKFDAEPIFVANNGLAITKNDKGVYDHTLDPADEGKFKIPGLHNVALTAPYMHDGRFNTLEEVVEHYSSGLKFHPNLHESLRDGDEVKNLNFTPEEKEALIGFLHALTDEKMIQETRWSDPFIK